MLVSKKNTHKKKRSIFSVVFYLFFFLFPSSSLSIATCSFAFCQCSSPFEPATSPRHKAHKHGKKKKKKEKGKKKFARCQTCQVKTGFATIRGQKRFIVPIFSFDFFFWCSKEERRKGFSVWLIAFFRCVSKKGRRQEEK